MQKKRGDKEDQTWCLSLSSQPRQSSRSLRTPGRANPPNGGFAELLVTLCWEQPILCSATFPVQSTNRSVKVSELRIRMMIRVFFCRDSHISPGFWMIPGQSLILTFYYLPPKWISKSLSCWFFKNMTKKVAFSSRNTVLNWLVVLRMFEVQVKLDLCTY